MESSASPAYTSDWACEWRVFLLQEHLEVTQNRGSGGLDKADVPLTASSPGQASPHSAVGLDSTPGSIGRGSATETSAEGVEAHILARIAAICQPGMYQKAKQAQVHSLPGHASQHQGYTSNRPQSPGSLLHHCACPVTAVLHLHPLNMCTVGCWK
jgi:hypothetical protein